MGGKKRKITPTNAYLGNLNSGARKGGKVRSNDQQTISGKKGKQSERGHLENHFSCIATVGFRGRTRGAFAPSNSKKEGGEFLFVSLWRPAISLTTVRKE